MANTKKSAGLANTMVTTILDNTKLEARWFNSLMELNQLHDEMAAPMEHWMDEVPVKQFMLHQKGFEPVLVNSDEIISATPTEVRLKGGWIFESAKLVEVVVKVK